MTAVHRNRDGRDRTFGRYAAPVAKMRRAELVAAWIDDHGQPPPKGLSTRLLEYSVAYEAQAREHGGLRPARRRSLARYAAPSKRADGAASRIPKAGPARGTRLVRDWGGATHIVDVLDDGVVYRGETYRSLSQVARVITGARWSGPRFFGL